MHVILDNHSLTKYFPLIVEELPVYVEFLKQRHELPNINSFNPYYFRNRDSNSLIVTLGDSWTWGAEVTGYHDFIDVRPHHWQVDNGVLSNINLDRVERVYGNILSQQTNSDWLNLGTPGWSNIQIAAQAQNLANIIPGLHYHKILVVVTLTEVGRWFNTYSDRHLDHAQLLQQLSSPEQLLQRLNHLAITQITSCLKDFSHVQLLVGTNFVDAIGFDSLQPKQRLNTPWYQLLGVSFDDPLYVTSEFAWNNFARSIEDNLIPAQLRSEFKRWLIETIDRGDAEIQKMQLSPYISKGSRYSAHPSAEAHQIWADYILGHVTC